MVAMDTGSSGFGFVDERLRAGVERLIDAGHDPGDAMAGYYVSPDRAREYADAIDSSVLDARLAEAARRLGLDETGAAVLALCVAPELDTAYMRVFGFLHDDVTRKLPSPRVIADLLESEEVSRGDVIGCFAEDEPLRRLGAVELLNPDGQRPFIDRSIRVASPLVTFLLGTRVGDQPLDGRVRALEIPQHDLGRAEIREQLSALLARDGRMPIVVAGPDAPELLAVALDQPLLLVEARSLGDRSVESYAALVCALHGRELVWDGLDDLDTPTRARVGMLLEDRGGRVLLCAESTRATIALGEGSAMVIAVPPPTLAERTRAWAELAGTDEVEEVAARFRLSIAQIETAASIATTHAAGEGRETPDPSDLAEGARQASVSRLGELANRLPPAFSWDDLVLPEKTLGLVHSISGYLRHRDRVLTEWGYAKTAQSQGLKVLFAGESGTGKTMAAQALAHELGLELFRVDLATVISKYVGETEKNLDRIFDAAQGSNAILFFDEADALFGRRSEVSDSHDRYANIEVAYLLQRMEGYDGAIILATNFRQNVDDAFVRRLDFSIEFPFPEEDDRVELWRHLLPASAPIADDVDLTFLARFKLSGGSIRNCSVSAAFAAAEDDEPIGMEHLVRAVAFEYGKQGRLTLESDFDRYHSLLRPDRDEPAASEPPLPPPLPAEPMFVRSRIEEVGGR
jgi:ATPase family associated with various cellular activities (AAA)/Winged helix domain, variant